MTSFGNFVLLLQLSWFVSIEICFIYRFLCINACYSVGSRRISSAMGAVGTKTPDNIRNDAHGTLGPSLRQNRASRPGLTSPNTLVISHSWVRKSARLMTEYTLQTCHHKRSDFLLVTPSKTLSHLTRRWTLQRLFDPNVEITKSFSRTASSAALPPDHSLIA